MVQLNLKFMTGYRVPHISIYIQSKVYYKAQHLCVSARMSVYLQNKKVQKLQKKYGIIND